MTEMDHGAAAACTIVSPNYLAFARTLAASYLTHHPDQQFFVLLVADLQPSDKPVFDDPRVVAVLLSEIGLYDMRREAMKYDILELNTNVKPSWMKYLIHTRSLATLVYLDPDIFVYSPLTPVFEALHKSAAATLTPHTTSPICDNKLPAELDMLYNGSYNLGFIGVRRCDEAMRLLDWWETRCLEQGFSEGRTGLFVDQKWMNLAPSFFPNLMLLRNPGCNMAYWNLHERTLLESPAGYLVEGAEGCEPLCFFHFSGIVIKDSYVLSRNTNRFTLADRPDLQRLFADYKAAVSDNQNLPGESLPYGFDTFSDGTVITRLARRIYSRHASRWSGQNPFDAQGSFASFARRHRLVDNSEVSPPKSTWNEFNPKDRRVELVHRLLKFTLRILGPHRYELLMRYLAHISVLRNQAVFLNDASDTRLDGK